VEEEFASKQTKSSKVTIFGSLWNNSFSYIWNLIIQGLKVVVRRSYRTYSIMPRLVRDAKYPPSSTIWRPFWALQWSPAKNRVVLQQGWDFLTVEVIEIRNKIHVPHSLNLLQWIVAWSIPEESTFRIPWVNNLFIYKAFCKFFCKIKRTCRTMLHSFMQNYAGPKNMCKKTRKTGGGRAPWGGIQPVSCSSGQEEIDKISLWCLNEATKWIS